MKEMGLKMNTAVRRFVGCCMGIIFALLVLEIALRLFYKAPRSYYIWPPGLETTFYPTPEIMPGISGPSHFSINFDGIRGDPITSDQTYRVLAMGGSTTECIFLDQNETWPHLLQVDIQNSMNKTAWVGNVGKSGALIEDNCLHFEHLIPQYRKMDLVIFLVGVNDLLQVLRYEGVENIPVLTPQAVLDRAFFSIPTTDLFYISAFIKPIRRNQLYQLSGVVQDAKGQYYVSFRQRRKSATLRTNLPKMAPALELYAKRVNRMIDLAHEKSVRVLFLTQPFIWRKDLSQEEQDLLWLGQIGTSFEGPQKYYSVQTLAEGMNLYNEKLKEVCRQRGVDCLDLDLKLSKSTANFYDDVHFNEGGARSVAKEIAGHLRTHAGK